MTEPHDLDAETDVLGACLLSSKAIDVVSEILSADDFYLPSHQRIYAAIVDFEGPVDAVTLANALPDEREKIHELAGCGLTYSNALHWAKIIVEKARLREVIALADELRDKAYENHSPDGLILEADKRLLKLQTRTVGRERVFTGKQLVEDLRAKVENPLDENRVGIKTPFSWLANLMGSRLYVLGGYTGDGKTALALQFLRSACEGGARVGFHSIEMSRSDLGDRLIASFGVPYHDVRTGHVSQSYRETFDKALETVASWDFDVIDDEEVDPGAVRRDQRAGKYDMLIIDHLHRIRIKDKRHAREELEENVRRITNIAKEFDVPVLLLAQLSREEKRNPFPRPTSASLKGSGAIEQEAAAVWFVWRLRDDENNPTSDAEFICTKNRYGPVTHRNLHFRAGQVRFTDVV